MARKIISCQCGKQFDVAMFYGGFRFKCDRCREELVVPQDAPSSGEPTSGGRAARTVAPRSIPIKPAAPARSPASGGAAPNTGAPERAKPAAAAPAAAPAPKSAPAPAVKTPTPAAPAPSPAPAAAKAADKKPPTTGSVAGAAWASQGGPPPEDLSGERILRGCRTVEFEGVQRPSIGGYVLLSKVGRGGMGVVYFAANPRTGKGFAIKILPWSSQPGHEGLVARFFREARLASQLESAHLVNVIDVDEDAHSGHHYLVMEFVRNISAGGWLREILKQAGPPAPESTALEIMIAATKGLASAHLAGIVHRDIKPDNILIPTKDGVPQFMAAKLADLGLARADTGEQSLTGAQFMLGTPGYMAPEQIRDSGTAKKPADVFGVGATLYALLAGKAPFAGSNAMHAVERTLKEAPQPIREIRPDLSSPTEKLLDVCLKQNRGERFPDAFALLEALEKCRDALGRDSGAVARAQSRVSELVLAEERGEKVRTDASLVPGADGAASGDPTITSPIGGATVAEGSPDGGQATVAAPRTQPREKRSGPAPAVPAPAKAVEQPRSKIWWMLPAGAVAVFAIAAIVLHGKGDDGKKPPTTAQGTKPAVAPVSKMRLLVKSDPIGAKVTVNGKDVGKTGEEGLPINDLPSDKHVVVVSAPYFEPKTATDAEIKSGVFEVKLVPAIGKLTVTDGPPNAKVKLTRQDQTRLETGFPLDAKGGGAKDVAAGPYLLTLSDIKGYEPVNENVDINGDTPLSLKEKTKAYDVGLSVTSQPPGAEVLVDGASKGVTPLTGAKVQPGEHKVVLRLKDYDELATPVTLLPGESMTLPGFTLKHWPVLDFSGIGAGVTASIGGEDVVEKQKSLPAGKIALVFRRTGWIDRSVAIDAALDQQYDVGKIAGPWPPELELATIDFSNVGDGVSVVMNGKPQTGGRLYAKGGDALDFTFTKSRYHAQTQKRVPKPGEQIDVGRQVVQDWKNYQALLDLSALAAVPGCRWSVNGEPTTRPLLDFADDARPVTVVAELTDYVPQTLTLTLRLGGVTKATLGPWQLAVREELMLLDLAEWKKANPELRMRQAKTIKAPGFGAPTLKTFSAGGQSFEVAVFRHNDTGLDFALIPGGSFVMGSAPPDDGSPLPAGEEQRQEKIGAPFLICMTEVPQELYQRRTGQNPSQVKQADLPVDTVAWKDADAFCRGLGMDLPQEKQWEYACRAGTTTTYFFGSDAGETSSYCWFRDNADGATHPVRGGVQPNAFGLLNMCGNVAEWCQEIPGTDPAWHVTRGSSYASPSKFLRSGYRGKAENENENLIKYVGVRPVVNNVR